MVAIRFLERSAFDTLARLVDPRGGYILLSTFIEEERETPRKVSRDAGGQSGDGTGGGRSVGKGQEGESPRRVAVDVDASNKNKPGLTAAALEAATAAATLARWPHASPRDYKKILRRGELARYFGDRHGFEVLEDSVDRLPDGRPIACFLARRVSECLQRNRGGGRYLPGVAFFAASGDMLLVRVCLLIYFVRERKKKIPCAEMSAILGERCRCRRVRH